MGTAPPPQQASYGALGSLGGLFSRAATTDRGGGDAPRAAGPDLDRAEVRAEKRKKSQKKKK